MLSSSKTLFEPENFMNFEKKIICDSILSTWLKIFLDS